MLDLRQRCWQLPHPGTGPDSSVLVVHRLQQLHVRRLLRMVPHRRRRWQVHQHTGLVRRDVMGCKRWHVPGAGLCALHQLRHVHRRVGLRLVPLFRRVLCGFCHRPNDGLLRHLGVDDDRFHLQLVF